MSVFVLMAGGSGGHLFPAMALAQELRRRGHDIHLMTSQPKDTTENVLPATVIRQVFLGGSRDYMVELSGGTQLRIVTQAEQSVAPGSAVWLHLPAEHCRALDA